MDDPSTAAAGGHPGGDTTIGDAVRFVDSRGVHWHVTERDARCVPGARHAACLVFMSANVVRRLWEYPLHWPRLSPHELAALCTGAPGSAPARST